jgi:DHA1 family bicyclomycin/chloramphenicol resistance-like MFS transporter
MPGPRPGMTEHMDAPSETETPSKLVTPWRLLALLMAMTAIGPATLNIMVPALPRLVQRLATDTGTVQLTLSLYLLSLAAAQLLLGPLSDRFGRRPVVLAGLALAVIASLAAIATDSINALIVARVVQAVGASTGIVMGRAIIRDLYERERAASMIGLVTTAMVIAPMISPLIGGILDTAFGWEAIFLFIAGFAALVLMWAALVLPETRPAGVAGAPAMLLRDWRALLADAKFHGYVLAGALGSAPFFTFLGGGPYVVVTLMGRSSAEFGLWFAVSSFGYMSGNFTAARLSQRFGVDAMIAGGAAFELVGSALTAVLVATMQDAGPAIIFLPQFVISFGNGLLLPNAIAGAISIRPHAAGAASGISGFAQMAVGAAATQVVSILLAGAASAMPMALMMLAVVLATGATFFALVLRRSAGNEL